MQIKYEHISLFSLSVSTKIFEKKNNMDFIDDYFDDSCDEISLLTKSSNVTDDDDDIEQFVLLYFSKKCEVMYGFFQMYNCIYVVLDLDGSTNSLTEKRKPTGPPENTTTYVVADRDTLTSVAARFDTTPSELTKLNRLGTPYIFPGQQLYVPLRHVEETESETTTPVEETHDDLPQEEKGKKKN